MKKSIIVMLLALLAFSFTGCAPKSFVKTSLANWRTIEFREELARDEAWQRIADTLAKNYDIEVIDTESGYIRSGWMFTRLGKVDETYRTRVIVKIPPSDDRVEIKTDAHWYDEVSGSWVQGYDTLLLDQIYTDLQGSVGRVTR